MAKERRMVLELKMKSFMREALTDVVIRDAKRGPRERE
jgi:hypothetical protein